MSTTKEQLWITRKKERHQNRTGHFLKRTKRPRRKKSMKSWSEPSRPVILHLTPNQEMTRTQTSKRSAHLILEDAVSALGLIQRFCLPRILSEREQDIRSAPPAFQVNPCHAHYCQQKAMVILLPHFSIENDGVGIF